MYNIPLYLRNNKLIPNKSWIKLDNDPILNNPLTKKLDINNLSNKDIEYLQKMINYVDYSYEGTDLDIKPGIAIAANQIGFDKRVIYIHFNDPDTNEEYRFLLANPEIINYSEQKAYLSTGEGCLSVSIDVEGYVIRNKTITVKGFDLLTNQEIIIKNAKGLLSMCLQHEIDHLNGILYPKRINISDPFNHNNAESI